ncbi:hypothetical protein SPAB_00077 [Salmonella enterica subsp. enterica serovar Paratyphi B str. SPB7]|uniref:Uncharacterized protein n=1 Tax=Salmonella paratyphi B (strain ATCC BAA-1250 / SPB7) TaxID=1016998 RepID=A0A6C6YWP0_SALPB|nr:hypothetical protein SPAB_00077 [Salmonella enterica subsp. enterica serovar Paratyphi B str. SPB7]
MATRICASCIAILFCKNCVNRFQSNQRARRPPSKIADN